MTEETKPENQEKDLKDMPNEGRPFLTIAVNKDGQVIVAGWTHDEMISDWLLKRTEIALEKMRDAARARVKLSKPNHNLINHLRNFRKN